MFFLFYILDRQILYIETHIIHLSSPNGAGRINGLHMFIRLSNPHQNSCQIIHPTVHSINNVCVGFKGLSLTLIRVNFESNEKCQVTALRFILVSFRIARETGRFFCPPDFEIFMTLRHKKCIMQLKRYKNDEHVTQSASRSFSLISGSSWGKSKCYNYCSSSPLRVNTGF